MGAIKRRGLCQALSSQCILVAFFIILISAEENQNSSINSPTVLTMCYLIERNMPGSIYDYNKAAASLDLAMEYANNYVLPPEIKLTNVYRNIGKTCTRRSTIVAYAMKLHEDGVNCSVYIGPGKNYSS
jgi:hypothetical protein